ncbi:uncharacterized protein [Neodiprion pinetum]|uniref:uncharacterized protein isoform X1 n=2 Tax=Neodiprion pinetum TaxID=441929 RepID=UPI001EE05980|nr:myb-like protein X isoform X1 [Neodiprion pinetum]XP_046470882.1 myb-like protein X isoform X1 [Neodiprion pinetum]
MGKTPKKAVPEGDERNRYVRRLKTASASSRQVDIAVNLPAARSVQPEYENTNRGKQQSTNVQKSFKAAGTSKTFKSKLRSPSVKLSMSRLPKSTNKPISIEKETNKTVISSKNLKSRTIVMQPKSEESESQTSENVSEQYIVDEVGFTVKGKRSGSVVQDDANEESTIDESHAQQMEKENEKKQDNESVNISQMEKEGERETEKVAEKEKGDDIQEEIGEHYSENCRINEREIKAQLTDDAISQILENDDSKEEMEEYEAKMNLSIDSSPLKTNLKTELNSSCEEPPAIDEEPTDAEKENGHVAADDREDQSEAPTETENYSVDVVESTTSEMSEASEPAQMESENARTKENQLLLKDDVSFVSFDASIMLKDVQVRLNDCLKDNSQLYELTNEERSMSEPLCKDSSFGRTLRNISGRHSINRMRHVTLRNRLSPNSSLYVNMSSVSLPDEDIRDHKIVRHRAGLTQSTLTCNGGTPSDRKRKLEPEVCSEPKKVKTDCESSLLNTSIGILQGLRRPIQVSTPNVGGYKFKSDKLDVSGIGSNDEKIQTQEGSGIVKQWCSIM